MNIIYFEKLSCYRLYKKIVVVDFFSKLKRVSFFSGFKNFFFLKEFNVNVYYSGKSFFFEHKFGLLNKFYRVLSFNICLSKLSLVYLKKKKVNVRSSYYYTLFFFKTYWRNIFDIFVNLEFLFFFLFFKILKNKKKIKSFHDFNGKIFLFYNDCLLLEEEGSINLLDESDFFYKIDSYKIPIRTSFIFKNNEGCQLFFSFFGCRFISD